MKKIMLATSSILLSTSLFAGSYLTPETNLDLLKAQIVQYHQSGAYDLAIRKTADEALAYIKQQVKRNKKLKAPKKLALILDIDETALSNYKGLAKTGFSGLPMLHEIQEKDAGSAIKPTLRVYQYAIKHGVTVFFITGRNDNLRKLTIKNLDKVGYKNVEQSNQSCQSLPVSHDCVLYMRSGKFDHSSAIPYKTAMRKRIQKAGYKIIANIGDQYSDLAGGVAQKTFKYPNYMYYVR